MSINKHFSFKVVDSTDCIHYHSIKSKHLNGAVRKLYQMYDVKDIIRIY